jgi:hypothetical protein
VKVDTPRENLRRRDKRVHVHPNTPNKYTEKELEKIWVAHMHGLKFGEFMESEPSFESRISRSTYERKRKEVINFHGNDGIPEWCDIPSKHRRLLGYYCASGLVPKVLFKNTSGNKISFSRCNPERTVSWGHILLLMRWAYRMGWVARYNKTWYCTDHLPEEERCRLKLQFHKEFGIAVDHDYVQTRDGRFIQASSLFQKMILNGENPFAEFTNDIDSEIDNVAA